MENNFEEQVVIFINKTVNNLCKNKLLNEIINDFENIKNTIFDSLNLLIENQKINKNDIESILKKIKINGIEYTKLEREWKTKTNTIYNKYSELNNILKGLNLFEKKFIFLEEKNTVVEVYDTGKKYIPTGKTIITEDIIRELDKLKEKEEGEYLADIFEGGFEAMNLTDKQFKILEKELIKRIQNKAKEQMDSFECKFDPYKEPENKVL